MEIQWSQLVCILLDYLKVYLKLLDTYMYAAMASLSLCNSLHLLSDYLLPGSGPNSNTDIEVCTAFGLEKQRRLLSNNLIIPSTYDGNEMLNWNPKNWLPHEVEGILLSSRGVFWQLVTYNI